MLRSTLSVIRFAGLLVAASAAALILAPSGSFAHEYKVGAIEIDHPWSRAMPPGARTGAGYLALTNRGTQDDRLVAISSPAAAEVQIHDMAVNDGVMTMRRVENGVAIPVGGAATLAPGGLHLMLLGVKEPFRQGDVVPLSLTFEKAGTVEVQLEVDAMGSRGEHAAHAQ